MAILGYDTNGASNFSIGNAMVGCRFTAAAGGDITDIHAFVTPKTASTQFAFAIYLDSDDTLLASTTPQTTSTTGEHEESASISVSITNGVTYILCVWGSEGPPAGTSNVAYDAGDTAQSSSVTDTVPFSQSNPVTWTANQNNKRSEER